jgi:hypothetical protein
LMRGADGVTGDVRDALYEAVGVRPTQCALACGRLSIRLSTNFLSIFLS